MVYNSFYGKNIDVAITQFSYGKDLLKYDKKMDILLLDIQIQFRSAYRY